MRDLLRAVTEVRQRGGQCVWCAVVETRGSTPQKAGAVMVVFPDGRQVGTLGGGCVEAEARQRALQMQATDQPALFHFTLDNDYGWDDGLICGGRMTFWAQPIGSAATDAFFRSLADLVEQGAGCTQAVVLDADKTGLPAGSAVLFDRLGQVLQTLHLDRRIDTIQANLTSLSSRPRPKVTQGVAYLPTLPRCRLLIVGAGHVGHAVAQLAHQVDFDVWVMDDRETYANRDRFPFAERILVVDDIGRALKDFPVDENTYCLIVTRGHSHDEEALFQLAPLPARYVGLIGSRRKIKLILSDLEKQGIPPAVLDRVYAPIGLSIGSQTVPEIAVSIIAQLISHRNLGPESLPAPCVDRE